DFFVTLQSWAEGIDWSGAVRLDQVRLHANEALFHYAELLRAMPTTRQLHAGDQVARSIVALAGIELSLAELHAMAAKFLAETSEVIENLRASLVAKYHLD